MSLVPTAEDRAYSRGFHDCSQSYVPIMDALNDTCNRLRDEVEMLKAERLKLDRRIHNQRVALRQNWEIFEMRRKYMGSPASRAAYARLLKRYSELKAEVLHAAIKWE